MSFRDLLADTFHTLAAHKRRTALTLFGITWGIVSIVLMVAAGEGLRVGFERKKAEFGRDFIVFWAGRTSLQVGGARAGSFSIPRCPPVRRGPSEPPLDGVRAVLYDSGAFQIGGLPCPIILFPR